MLRLLTPDVVANAAKTEIQTGDRVCLNWEIENLTPPGNYNLMPFSMLLCTKVGILQGSVVGLSNIPSNGSILASPSTMSTTSIPSNPLNGTVSDTTMPQLQHQKILTTAYFTAGQLVPRLLIQIRRALVLDIGQRRASQVAAY